MLILSADRVDYCPVVKIKGDPSKVLKGIRYQDKLFTQTQRFPKDQKQEAIQRAKDLVLKNKARFLVLVIEDTKSYQIWTQNSNVRVREIQEIPVADLNLEKVVGKMLKTGGLAIEDRQYKLRTYPRCFIGAEAMVWLQETLKLNRDQALQLGQRLIEEKWMHHVTDEHSFKDDYLFYRFYRDE